MISIICIYAHRLSKRSVVLTDDTALKSLEWQLFELRPQWSQVPRLPLLTATKVQIPHCELEHNGKVNNQNHQQLPLVDWDTAVQLR